MIDRRHIEKLLHLNGLHIGSPEEQIKSLLISARWHEDDVETALVVLKEDPKSHQQHIDTVHKIFRSSEPIKPETLNALLGIEVNLRSVSEEHHESLERAYRGQIISMAVITVLIAIIFLILMMWFLQVGIFHDQW